MIPRTIIAAVAATGAALVAAVPASAAAAPTVVSIGFDDGLKTQEAALPILAEHAAPATFFVNTGSVGRSRSLTWEQLTAISAAGHEVGGHSTDHPLLPSLPPAEAQAQVCGDRGTLATRGFAARSFAYPFGRTTPAINAVVAGCRYLSARTTTVPDGTAEGIPPALPFETRAFQWDATLDPAVFLSIVDAATAGGGGWVQFVFHDVCAEACDELAITPTELDAILDGLAARPAVRIRTTGDVVGADAEATPVQFPTTTQVGSSSTATTTVRNVGGGALRISRASITGGGGAMDVTTDRCSGATVAPGGSCKVTVRFEPTVRNATTTATLGLVGNADPVTTAVPLSARSAVRATPAEEARRTRARVALEIWRAASLYVCGRKSTSAARESCRVGVQDEYDRRLTAIG